MAMNMTKIKHLSEEHEELTAFLTGCNNAGMCLGLGNPGSDLALKRLSSSATGEILGGLRRIIRDRLTEVEELVKKEIGR